MSSNWEGDVRAVGEGAMDNSLYLVNAGTNFFTVLSILIAHGVLYCLGKRKARLAGIRVDGPRVARRLRRGYPFPGPNGAGWLFRAADRARERRVERVVAASRAPPRPLVPAPSAVKGLLLLTVALGAICAAGAYLVSSGGGGLLAPLLGPGAYAGEAPFHAWREGWLVSLVAFILGWFIFLAALSRLKAGESGVWNGKVLDRVGGNDHSEWREVRHGFVRRCIELAALARSIRRVNAVALAALALIPALACLYSGSLDPWIPPGAPHTVVSVALWICLGWTLVFPYMSDYYFCIHSYFSTQDPLAPAVANYRDARAQASVAYLRIEWTGAALAPLLWLMVAATMFAFWGIFGHIDTAPDAGLAAALIHAQWLFAAVVVPLLVLYVFAFRRRAHRGYRITPTGCEDATIRDRAVRELRRIARGRTLGASAALLLGAALMVLSPPVALLAAPVLTYYVLAALTPKAPPAWRYRRFPALRAPVVLSWAVLGLGASLAALWLGLSALPAWRETFLAVTGYFSIPASASAPALALMDATHGWLLARALVDTGGFNIMSGVLGLTDAGGGDLAPALVALGLFGLGWTWLWVALGHLLRTLGWFVRPLPRQSAAAIAPGSFRVRSGALPTTR